MFINIVIIDIDRVVLRNWYESSSEGSRGVAFGALNKYFFLFFGATVRLPKDILDSIGDLTVWQVMTAADILFPRKNILSCIDSYSLQRISYS